MKRRDFFKKGTQGAIGVSMLPVLTSSVSASAPDMADRSADNWQQLGSGKKGIPTRIV